MAEFSDIIDDSVSTTDEALSSSESLRSSVDIADLLDSSEITFEGAQSVTIDDTVAVTDEAARVVTAIGDVATDSVTAIDSVTVQADRLVTVANAMAVTDSVVVGAIIALKIASVSALSKTRVRITFEAPALINAALTSPTSYHFDNVSPGSVGVVPLSVILPVGQVNPIYVDVELTEHTNGKTYEVGLGSNIRGAMGEIGHPVPVTYVGIGVEPTLQVVIGTSATEAEVHFSESVADNASANDPSKYTWTGGISTIAVRSVNGNVVTLQTTAQVPGELYTLTVQGQIIGSVYELELGQDDCDAVDAIVSQKSTEYAREASEVAVMTDSVAAELIAPAATSYAIMGGHKSLVDAFPQRNEVQLSSDGGNTWVRTFGNNTGNVIRAGARNTATNVVIFVGDNGLLLRSTDGGVNYTVSSPFGAVPDMGALWYGNGVWVVNYFEASAANPNVRYSLDDGATWSAPINPDGGTGTGPTGGAPAGSSDLWWDGVYAPSLGLHVGVGYKGSIWTSPDGATWTRRTAANNYIGSTYGFRGVAWSEAQGLLVAVGDASECQTSPDGVNWAKRTFSATNPFTLPWDVTYSPALDLWLVVGSGASSTPRIQTSPDGINWTSRTPAGTTDIYCCAWDSVNSRFIACGKNAQTQNSSDGVTWTLHNADNSGGGTFVGSGSIFKVLGGGEPT